MNRCAIYVRYSSDIQKASSLSDQERECRAYAEAKGWTVVEIYADAAISGSSDNRPEYQRMLLDAENEHFDIILAESLDRLSRKLSHTAALHDELSFSNVRLFTKAQDEITKIQTAILGFVSEQFIGDLRDKVRRGQRGVVLKGKAAGGIGYGYRTGKPGERIIDEDEAHIVIRILTEYASGVSPRAIAKSLNDEGIAGPSGREWKDTTIRGQRDRGTGILNKGHA